MILYKHLFIVLVKFLKNLLIIRSVLVLWINVVLIGCYHNLIGFTLGWSGNILLDLFFDVISWETKIDHILKSFGINDELSSVLILNFLKQLLRTYSWISISSFFGFVAIWISMISYLGNVIDDVYIVIDGLRIFARCSSWFIAGSRILLICRSSFWSIGSVTATRIRTIKRVGLFLAISCTCSLNIIATASGRVRLPTRIRYQRLVSCRIEVLEPWISP